MSAADSVAAMLSADAWPDVPMLADVTYVSYVDYGAQHEHYLFFFAAMTDSS